MYWRAISNSTDGLIVSGYMYVNNADGPLRGMSSLEWDFISYVRPSAPVVQFEGNDIRSLVKILGLRTQGAPQGLHISNGKAIFNDGQLTGNIVF